MFSQSLKPKKCSCCPVLLEGTFWFFQYWIDEKGDALKQFLTEKAFQSRGEMK